MTIDITSHETGVVRLFAIELPETEVKGFTEQVFGPDDAYAWPLKDALGATFIDHDFIEVFPVSNVAGLGLSGYLSEGLAVADADLEGHREEIDGLDGHVLIVLSRAFDGVAQTLAPKPPLRIVGTFHEAQGTPAVGPLHAEAAKGRVEPSGDAVPAQSGRKVATGPIVVIALIIAAALVFALSGLGG